MDDLVDSRPGLRQFAGWTKQTDPDAAQVRTLYVDEGLTEGDIARRLRVSRQRVKASLAATGVERRRATLACPVSDEELRSLYVDHGLTQSGIAERFGVASGTAARWLAECGLTTPDPRIDHARLRALYVDERLTVREVAAEFGLSHNRVIRELALAGVLRRSCHERRPRGPRAAVTQSVLRELYVERGLTIKESAHLLGVGTEYLRKRLRECGIAKRPGTFRPKTEHPPRELRRLAAELYLEGLTMRQVGDQLGVSVSTVRKALHEEQVVVRPGGFQHVAAGLPERHLLKDLYADPEICEALLRHDVPVQDPANWHKAGPTEAWAPLPLHESLVRDLYVGLGLSTFHVGLLCGVDTGSVIGRLREYGIPARPRSRACPWVERTYLRSGDS